MTPNEIKMQVAAMSRESLESEAVEAMVARWGEAERAGCAKMASGKSIDSLRIEAADVRGVDGSKLFGRTISMREAARRGIS